MGQKIRRLSLCLTTVFALAFAVTSCDSASEPVALSDQKLSELVDLVEAQAVATDSPNCQVEVFRIQEDTTFGWATCAPSTPDTTRGVSQAEEFPFRIDGDKVRRPAEGAKYQEEVKTLFPEDLHSAINQHSTGVVG